MNEFGTENASPKHAEWKAPPDGFEAFGAPAVPEGGNEYRSEQAEAGQAIKHIIQDAEGRTLFQRETSPSSDWQKAMAYDNEGRLSELQAQKLTPGQESHTRDSYEYDEKNQATKTGTIEFGQDAGHRYRELPIVEKDLGEGRIIRTITTEILEQGQNGSGTKAEKGTVYTKMIYLEKGKWLGEKVIGSNGTESTQFPEGVQELPNWE